MLVTKMIYRVYQLLHFESFLSTLFFKLSNNNRTLSLFYIGYLFLLIHMSGQWFFLKCDFEHINRPGTFYQYFVDNILGNLIIKPNNGYSYTCNFKTKKRIKRILINRNLSIFFLSLFLISFFYPIPYFGKTFIKTINT